MRAVRPDRQTLLFSATFKKRVRRVADSVMKRDRITVEVGRAGTSSENVSQIVHIFDTYQSKRDWLMSTLPILVSAGRTIVFVGTREDTENLAQQFKETSNINTDSIHGDKTQVSKREMLTLGSEARKKRN